jgi:hypothetical protein
MVRKPDTRNAMYDLIRQVRTAVPFDMPVADICVDDCYGCPKKLLEYLDMELDDWQQKLDDGNIPNFGDLNALAKRSKKITTALKKNGIRIS